MIYAKVVDNNVTAYPYGMTNLRSDNPNTSFPKDSFSRADIRAEHGIYEVVMVEKPVLSGHKAIEGTPSFSGGVCTQVWNQVLKEPNEVTSEEQVGEDYMGHGVSYPGHEGQRPTQVDPVWDGSQWEKAYIWENVSYDQARVDAYGPVNSQIEFITENGLDAWQAKVAEIKARFPK
tara:strand:+ start:202 stop:729 length:528 start_codon:yes stop_codon:yes gene_type:complete